MRPPGSGARRLTLGIGAAAAAFTRAYRRRSFVRSALGDFGAALERMADGRPPSETTFIAISCAPSLW